MGRLPLRRPRCYMIASVPRSGSTLLARALEQTGLAGRPAEYFNRAYDPYARYVDLPLREYVDFLKLSRSTPNGAFGFKIHYYQFEAAWPDRQIEGSFPGLRYLFIQRRDRLRQAVSFARAIQTRQWDSEMAPQAEPCYDGPMIGRRLAAIEAEEKGWEGFFAERGLEPLRISYEDLADSYEAMLLRVLRFLGIALPSGFRTPPPPISRQADALTERWVARYLEEAAAGADP